MKIQLHWDPKTTPAELHSALRTLAIHYPISEGRGKGLATAFEQTNAEGLCEVEHKGTAARIKYSTPAQAARAVGALLSGLVKKHSTYRETTQFTTFGIMLDCSRNAVMTVDRIKIWLDKLALVGYNMVMLYTEETYELPGEPFFGRQRGAYTKEELKAIDAYAARLNIEIVPCIQTLGHLEKLLRHSAYEDVKDTGSVLLAGEPKTYKLIEKMIKHWRSVCRTNRIHVGMDETHDLGRGRYMDIHGFRPGFDLFNEHLAKVVKICKKNGFKPIIWSDMYFRLGSKIPHYYDPQIVIPQGVIKKIPKQAELVYWDYYHEYEAFYLEWIERHRLLGKEPLMGSGIWTWNKYWYDRRITEANAGACIDACREAGVREIFFTMWGDYGAFCDFDSAFAGMVYCAEKAYGTQRPSKGKMEKRFAAVCGGSYAAHILASDIQGGVKGLQPDMWEDPLFDTHLRTWAKDDVRKMRQASEFYADLSKKLERYKTDRTTGDLLHAHNIAHAFALRYSFSALMLSAYRKRDKAALGRAAKEIRKVTKAIGQMADSFRNMWLRHNKPEGMEHNQARFGALQVRYRELETRIAEFISGEVSSIVEMEYRCPPK